VIAIAWKAQQRLHQVWRRLDTKRSKRKTIVAVAAARRLAGFCWAISPCPLTTHPPYEPGVRGSAHGHASSRAAVAESLFVASRQAWHRHVPDYHHCSRTTMRAVL
jgi:hypothetical protein